MNKRGVLMGLGGLLLATTASAGDSAEIYGILDTGVAITKGIGAGTTPAKATSGDLYAMNSGIQQASRYGFRGKEDLGGGLSATFVLEAGITVTTGALAQNGAAFGRRSTLGLSGDFGAFEIGRRKDFTDEVAFAYSSVKTFGSFINGAHDNNLDRVGGNRANNMLIYHTPTLNGLRGNVTYAFGNAAGSTASGQAFGWGMDYAPNQNFGVGFGYWQSKLGVVSSSGNTASDQGATSGAGCNTVGLGQPGDTCIKTWMLGSHYSTGPVNIRGTYSEVRQPLAIAAGKSPNFSTAFLSAAGSGAFASGGINNSRTNIVDVGVDWSASEASILSASFIRSNNQFVGAQSGQVSEFLLGYQYYFSKRTNFYAFLARMTSSNMYNPGISGGAPGLNNGQTATAFGLRHYF